MSASRPSALPRAPAVVTLKALGFERGFTLALKTLRFERGFPFALNTLRFERWTFPPRGLRRLAPDRASRGGVKRRAIRS
ncbi:MAG: hypothetical protein CMF26_01055 [Kiloniella sp.]|nr:hypothetical protein [Kiloniella sp.]